MRSFRFGIFSAVFLVAASAFCFCANDADCNNHGRCDQELQSCQCDEGYTDGNCDYKQYQQVTAFFLHLFFGIEFGAGDFYIKDLKEGGIKLALFWGSLASLGFGHNGQNRGEFGCGFGLGLLGIVGSLVWWIVDLASFARNSIEDGDNKPLESW